LAFNFGSSSSSASILSISLCDALRTLSTSDPNGHTHRSYRAFNPVLRQNKAEAGRPLARAGARGGEDLPLAPASAEQQDILVVMEATGHYWQNLFAALVAHGYAVALVNPLRTHRFAGEELARTKTDRIDCLQIARFGAQKRPAVTYLPDALVEELRELVRLRMRLIQGAVDRVNQLHRLVDLGFPEFTRYLGQLNSPLATTILLHYPTAQAFHGLSRRRLAQLCYDGRHQVGAELAQQLIEAAKASVGSQHSGGSSARSTLRLRRP
jgi:transposase